MKRILLLLFSVATLFAFGQGTVSTSPTLTANNGQAGITFQVQANTPVNITGIGCDLDPGFTGIDVWMRVGGVKSGTSPNVSTAGGWTKVVTNATAPNPVTGTVTAITIATPISIPANTPVGFYVNSLGGSQVNYRTGQSTDQVVFSDGTLTLSVADSVAYGGGLPNPTFNPRRFIGSVTYALGISGSCANMFSNFSVDSIGTDSAVVNWTPGTGNTGFRMEYGLQGFTQGNGTVVTGSYPANNPPITLTGLTPDSDYDIYFTEYCGTDSVYFPGPQSFTTEPICPAPSNITILSLDSVSVTFTYTATTDSINWEWGPNGFQQGTGTSGTAIGDTVTVSGLSPNTAYDLVITSDCSDRGDGLSRPSRISFTTDCGYASVRFTENFDASAFPCLRAYTDVSVGAPSVSITTGFSPTSPPQQLFLSNSSATGAGEDVILVFQPFYGMNNLNRMVEFNAKTSASTTTTLDVVSFPNPDSLGIYNVIQTVTLNGSNQRFTVNLDANSNYNGTDQIIGLRHGAQSTFQSIYVDDFVYDVIPTCPPINPFSVNYSAVGSNVYLSWSSGNSSQGGQVTWGSPGFTPGSNSNLVTTPDSTATVSGLSPNTVYDFYIQDSCGTNDVSVWVGPYSILTGCAAPSPTNLPWTDGFENYSTGPTFNGSANLCDVTHSWRFEASDENTSRLRLQAGAAYYRNGVQAATLDHNPSAGAVQTNYLTLTVNLSNYTTSGGIELGFYVMSHAQEANPNNRVWARGAPTDPWIEVADLDAIRTASATYDSVQSLNIKAFIDAAGQSIGAETQIRFGQAGRFSSFSTSFSDGFTFDDITLNAVSCPEPAGITAGNLYDTTATMSWTGSASNYQYWFGPGGFYQGSTTLGGTKAFTTNNSVVIDTLSGQTCYQFLVRSVCAAGDTSAWAGPFDFCTPCSPISAPYFEDWDGLTAQSKDLGCFTSIEDPGFATSNFIGVTVQNSSFYNPTSSPNYIEFDNSNVTTSPLMMISPPASDITAGDKRIRFMARKQSATYPSELVVGTMSDPSDASTFHLLDTVFLDGTTFTEHIVNITTLNGYNGTDQYFVIAHNQADPFDYLLVDDLHYEVIPTCPEASNLAVLAVDSMNATLKFDPFSGSAGNFQIEYGGSFLGSSLNSQVLVTNDTVTLTSLTPNTNYCFWVREICVPGDTSNWVGPVCFKTLCQAISAPYYENWDNLSAQSKDLGCFSSIEDPSFATSNFVGVTIQNSSFYAPPTSPNYIELDNSNQTASPLMLISPITTDLNAGDKRIRFMARKPSTFYPSTLLVGTMSNPSDANTFTALDTLTLDATQFTEHTVEFTTANGYNGTDDFFVIAHDQADPFDFLLVDEINYEVIPTCVRPDSLAITNITQNSAFASWVNGNGSAAGSYQIEYGLGLLGDASNTRTIINNDTITLNGLTAGTGYCFWVREICTPGDTSLWLGPVCFSTPCPTSYNAPYFTNFEGISLGTASGTPAGWENCWTHNTISGSVRWESEDASGANENSLNTGPFYDNTFSGTAGGTYMYLETSTSGGPAELISPGIDISTVTNPELEYHYHMHGATINKLVVYAENSTGTRTAIDSIIGQQQAAQSDPFLRRNVPLAGLTAGVYKFVFEGHRGTSFTGDISIDDVSVQQGASCPRPLSLTAEGLSPNSAVARWNDPSGALSYQVEFGPAGFTPGTGTMQTSTADSLVLTFANANNLCQEVYVRSICTVGDTSQWVGPTAVCPTPVLCDSLDQYNNASTAAPIWDQSALFVQWAGSFGGDTEISTTQANSAPNSIRIHDLGTQGLSDIVALFDTISSGAWEINFDMFVPTGDGAYFNIQQNYVGGGTGNLWGGEVYFLATGTAEAVYSTGSIQAGTFTYNQNQWFTMTTVIDLDNDTVWFEVNGNSVNVGYQYSLANAGGPLQFNGINFYSGVKAGNSYDCNYYFDNFCINPRVSSCTPPTGLIATSNVGCDSIELDWTSNSGTSVLEYGPSGFTPGTGTAVNVSATPYTVSGLSPGTSYDFIVADICGNDTSATVTNTTSTASGPLPVAAFTYSSDLVNSQSVVYVDASSSSNGSSFTWDFGNGVSGSGMMDTVVYVNGGATTITLIVTNGCGSDTATISLDPFGVEESLLGQSLNVYPNPATNYIQLDANSASSAAIEIVLRDAQGRAVISTMADGHNGHLRKQIDVSQLASGMYILELHQDGLKVNRRLSIR